MNCIDCDTPMEHVVSKSDIKRNIAFNVFTCERCLIVCVHHVWDYGRRVWVCIDHTLVMEDDRHETDLPQ